MRAAASRALRWTRRRSLEPTDGLDREGAEGVGERDSARLGGDRGDLGPRWLGHGEHPALAPVDVEVGEHGELLERLDALGADGRADNAGEADEGLDERHPRRIAIDLVDEIAVDLDDVRAHPHELLEPGVAGAGVVDGDHRSALAQVGDRGGERLVVGDELVLGDLDDQSLEVAGRVPPDDVGAERRGTDVDRQVCRRMSGRAGSRAARMAAASSSAPRPQPCAWANQTSGVRPPAPGKRASAS